jgi:hypothetical protein
MSKMKIPCFGLISIMTCVVLYPAQSVYAKDMLRPNVSLCNTNEKIIFNCNIKNSANILSVCASQNLSKDSGYIQYRFGRKGAIELEYPAEKEMSRSSFLFARYTRFQVSKLTLRFSNNKVNYTIFDNYDAESRPYVKEKGIEISGQRMENKNIKLFCDQDALSNLEDLEDIVPCDENLSLGGCK